LQIRRVDFWLFSSLPALSGLVYPTSTSFIVI